MHEVATHRRAAYSAAKHTLEARPNTSSACATPDDTSICGSANTSSAFATMSANSAMPTARAAPRAARTSSKARNACRLSGDAWASRRSGSSSLLAMGPRPP